MDDSTRLASKIRPERERLLATNTRTDAAARASAIAALSLLASAVTACAPCAWVLWEISSPTSKHPNWTYTKVGAEATNEACKQRAELAIQRRTLQAKPYGWTVTRGDANRVNFKRAGDPDSFHVDFECWPDNVDPGK